MNNITAKQVEEKLNNGDQLNIIDVRETHEVAFGKIPSAVNIPLGLLEYRMQDLDKNKAYIIVCHSGGRSALACNFLESYGYNVTNMDGGMLSWDGEVE